MTFEMPNDKFNLLVNELKCSQEHASELAISCLLDERIENAKAYAKRAYMLGGIIHDILKTAEQ